MWHQQSWHLSWQFPGRVARHFYVKENNALWQPMTIKPIFCNISVLLQITRWALKGNALDCHRLFCHWWRFTRQKSIFSIYFTLPIIQKGTAYIDIENIYNHRSFHESIKHSLHTQYIWPNDLMLRYFSYYSSTNTFCPCYSFIHSLYSLLYTFPLLALPICSCSYSNRY